VRAAKRASGLGERR